MKFKDVLGMAFKDLGKRKGRTFLTSLAVAIGSMLVVTMVGIGVTAEKMVLDQLKQFSSIQEVTVINQKYQDPNSEKDEINSEADFEEFMEKNFKKIDGDAAYKLNNINGVSEIQASIQTPISSIKIGDKESKHSSVVGYDLNYKIFAQDRIESVKQTKKDNSIQPIYAGRILNSSDKSSVLVGQQFLKSMGISDYKSAVGKEISLIVSSAYGDNTSLKPFEIKGQIVGVIDERFDSESKEIIVPIDMAATLKGYTTFDKNYLADKGYDQVVIHARSSEYVGNIGKEVKNIGYEYMSFEKIAEQVKEFFTIGKEILAVLGIVVLFVAAVGIVNTMTMVIHEKTRYIGIMKSLGASRQNIHNIFLTQAASIGFIGGMMGLLFSFINSKIIEVVLKMYLQKQGSKDIVVNFVMPSWLVLGTLGFAILIALISGVYPSRKASKLDPVQALNS